MSNDFPNTQDALGLTRYWGGSERGFCVQLTQLEYTAQAGKCYVSVPVDGVPKLIADLAKVFNADSDNPKLAAERQEPGMNQQQQIDIIQAHMGGKRVLVWISEDGEGGGQWTPIIRGEYNFDFRNDKYKIEPRRIELFMGIPSGVLQALGRAEPCHTGFADVSNTLPTQIPAGHVLVKINYLEP